MTATMTTASATKIEDRLPPLFRAACDLAPPFDRPFLAGPWLAATDGRIAVRGPASAFRVAARARVADDAVARSLEVWFDRWEPDGRTLILPVGIAGIVACPRCDGDPATKATCLRCEGEGQALNRRRVRLAPGVDLAAYRVATLLDCGVREVRSGTGLLMPVRFAVGVVEGLLMTMREEAR